MAGSDHTGRRRRRFQPFKKLQRLFHRWDKVHIGSEDVPPPNAGSPHSRTNRATPQSHASLGESQESIEGADAAPGHQLTHHHSAASIPSLPSSSSQLTAELRNVLTKKQRSEGADDDSGVPRTPTTSPATQTQQMTGKGSGARWGDSDGSLLSIYSSGTGTDDEPFTPLSSHSSKLSLARDNDSGDLRLESPVPLSHAAAKHRIAVRPRRPRRPRTRGTALPATLEEASPEPEPERGAAHTEHRTGPETGAAQTERRVGTAEQADQETGAAQVEHRADLETLPDAADEDERRAPSASPERARNSLPPVAMTVDPPAPAVQRSRSSLADRRLRHLSPRKLFSRAADSAAERKSEGGGGFFSRIFGSRRSGRKTKLSRGMETGPEAKELATDTGEVVSSQQRARPPSGSVQKRRNEAKSSQQREMEVSGSQPVSMVEGSLEESDAKPALRGSLKHLDALDSAVPEGLKCDACRESEHERRSLYHETAAGALSQSSDNAVVSTEDEKTEPDRTSRSEDQTDSESSRCSLCMTDTGSEGSPCVLRRHNAPLASPVAEGVDSETQVRSRPTWTESDFRQSPSKQGSGRRSLPPWTGSESLQEPERTCVEHRDSSPVQLRRAFPRYSATKGSAAANSGEAEPRSDLESGEVPENNEVDKRKTYTISSSGTTNTIPTINTEAENVSAESATELKTPGSLGAEDKAPQFSTSPENVRLPSKSVTSGRRSLPYVGLPRPSAGLDDTRHPNALRSSANDSSLAQQRASEGPENSEPPSAAEAADPPEPPPRHAGGFGVVLRSVSRSEPVGSGPHSLDSVSSVKSEKAEPATRGGSSFGGDAKAVVNENNVGATIGGDSRPATEEREQSSDSHKDDRSCGYSSVTNSQVEIERPVKTRWRAAEVSKTEKDNATAGNAPTHGNANADATISSTSAASVELLASTSSSANTGLSKDASASSYERNAVDQTPGGTTAAAMEPSSPCVPEFMKVQLHPVDTPLPVVYQVVLPKRPAPVLLTTPFIAQRTSDEADKPAKASDAESNVQPTTKASDNSSNDSGPTEGKSNGRTVTTQAETKPASVQSSVSSSDNARKDNAGSAAPPKSPDAGGNTASAKESPVVLRKKSPLATEESELAKVFKRRSLKLVAGDDTPQKLQTSPEPVQPGTGSAAAEGKITQQETSPVSAWRQQKPGASVAREPPVSRHPPDSTAARPWKPTPSVANKVRPVSSAESRPPANNAELHQTAAADDGATVAAEAARAGASGATPRSRDDDNASTANWLKQTVRERREQRELRELKHLRQPYAKELVIEPETLVPGRTATPRSSRVLAMASSFQKLQPT